MLRKALLFLFVNLFLFGNALADVAECRRAYQAQRYEGAVDACRPVAIQGHSEAQHIMGVLYYLGRGVRQDPSEAREWFYRAADNGWAAAQYNLSLMLQSGIGGYQDNKDAWAYLSKAAQQGLPTAQVRMGVIHRFPEAYTCLLYTSPSPRDRTRSRMPSSA